MYNQIMKKLLVLIFIYLFSFAFTEAGSLCNFTRSLTVGFRGSDVSCLQTYLQEKGFYKYSGGVTGYFGVITKGAVSQWQAVNKILPIAGFFGPISRSKYKNLTVFTNSVDNNQTVNLPEVKDEEIIININGVGTTEDYINYFLNHYSDIVFDGKKFETILKDEYGTFLLISDLVQKTIDEGASDDIKKSLLIYKEFIEAKIVFLKSIKVYGSAIDLHKETIGFDKLTLQLIQKITNLQNTQAAKQELSDFYKNYTDFATTENKKLIKEFGLAVEKPGLLQKVITWLRLDKEFIAYAQGSAFGGMIGLPIFCTCSAGWLIHVGPPTPPSGGSLFVPVAFSSSPLFFINKSMAPGSWWLGLSGGAVPCLQLAPGGCVSVGMGSLIFMTGTS
jgi:peptidoglycan hydrolase-like protein with peptidoglycan-binding domain